MVPWENGAIVMTPSKRGALNPEAILARINGGKSEAKFHKDQIVYSQGDPADCIFFVQSGKVKVTVVSEEGKEAVVAILQTGNFCGEECLTGHKLRMSTLKTLTDCTLIKLPKGSTMRALHEDQGFSQLF